IDLAKLPSPVSSPIGLNAVQPAVRNITANCPTALDAADDTDNINADFTYTLGFVPRRNTVTPTQVVCPTPPGATSTTPTTQKCSASKSSAEASKNKKKKKKKSGCYKKKKKKKKRH